LRARGAIDGTQRALRLCAAREAVVRAEEAHRGFLLGRVGLQGIRGERRAACAVRSAHLCFERFEQRAADAEAGLQRAQHDDLDHELLRLLEAARAKSHTSSHGAVLLGNEAAKACDAGSI
jgi:hypothetical protein